MTSLRMARKQCIALGISTLCLVAAAAVAGEVKAYQKDITFEIKHAGKPVNVTQKRWYLENDHVRVAAIADPGGAIVEFIDKSNDVNYVTGPVYATTIDGEVVKKAGWGWKDYARDNNYDPMTKWALHQKYELEFQDGENGAKTIKATGQTAEQRVERWHTLRPDSGELLVKVRQTNISDKPRNIMIRWHPYSYVSSDRLGESACVLSPGAGSQVRKLRIGWGWDHWLRTHKNYWLGADWRTGEGLFTCFEPEKVPYHFTWTYYRNVRNEYKGSVTLETMPVVELKGPGEYLETNFTFFPFTKDTKPEDFPLTLVAGQEEQAEAVRFIQNVKHPSHLELMNRYTFARTIQFHWHHRRRDLFGVRDWGFADCAVILFPRQNVPMRVRMIGGAFDEASKQKRLARGFNLSFRVTVANEDGQPVYSGNQSFPLEPGVAAKNYFDREMPIPMSGIPDGNYTARVEVIDPLTRKPFHHHEMSTVVFGQAMDAASVKGEEQFRESERERPFVAALAKIDDVAVQDGKVVIPVGVEDGSSINRKSFPVRLGVPFPKGAFKPDAPARLLSPAGSPVPAYLSTMNVWPDQSLKWALVDFQADCPADGFAFYKLEVGKGVAPMPDGQPLVKESPEAFEINTGPMLIRIDRKKLSVPGEVSIDSNRDGKFEAGEQVILPSQSSDIWWNAEIGRAYAMQLGGEAIHDNRPGVEIESNGPLSAVVKVSGWYLDKDRQHVAFGEARIEVFRGKPFFKLWHRVTFTGSPWSDRLASYGLQLRFAPGRYDRVFYAIDGRGVEGPTGPSALYQGADNRVTLSQGSAVFAKGSRASGAVRLAGPGGSMVFYHRKLWQMYPKKMAVDPGKGLLTMHYWPEEGGPVDFGPYEEYWIPSSSGPSACGTGLSREQEMVLDFSNALAPEAAEAVYDEPVVACTPPQWVHDTDVLLNLHPYDREKHPEIEHYVSTVIDFFQRNREFFRWYGHWQYGTLHNVFEVPTYQWLVIGRYANIGNEEDIAQTPWLLYFRSGDRRFLKFARAWTRHLMGPQSIRWHHTFPEFIGMSRRHHYTVWLGGGDWGHTMLCPWLEYYHATGYYPAWDMAKRTSRAMAQTYSGAWRYISNPLIGNVRMYLETGDEKYRAVADRIWKDLCHPDQNRWYGGSHGSRMALWYSQISDECKKLWIEWSTKGKLKGDKLLPEFQLADSLGALGDLTGDDELALKCRTRLAAGQSHYTGLTHGTNPVHRGRVPTITQYLMGYVRRLPYAAAQIAKSREIFPAEFVNISKIKEIVVKEEHDADFTIWMNSQNPAAIKLNGPDGKPAQFAVTPLVGQTKGPKGPMAGLVKVEVKADGKTGGYRLPTWRVQYLGCSLKNVAIRSGNGLHMAGGCPLYVRSDDLGGEDTRVFLSGSPGSSFEIFTIDGRPLFSKTYYRPGADAVSIEHRVSLPPGTVLRLRDKIGVSFPDLEEIPLYLNFDGVFDLP